MTINELEQGIRNLIATQPMVSAGANGEVINGINAIIDAYRNLNFRIQAYPCQDVMKFGLTNESAKLENTLSNLALQVMQERGINLMLYVPRMNAGFGGPMVNQYGMVNQPVDSNMMMGQMMYNAGSMPSPTSMMGMPGMMGAGRQMPAPAYNTMQPQMMGVASTPYARPSRGSAPTFPGYQNPDKPIHLEPTRTTAESMRTRSAPQDKIKQVPKANSPAAASKQTTKPVEEVPEEAPEIPVATAPSAAEMLIAGATGGAGGGGGKAQGRDYLMELLKK